MSDTSNIQDYATMSCHKADRHPYVQTHRIEIRFYHDIITDSSYYTKASVIQTLKSKLHNPDVGTKYSQNFKETFA